MLSGADKDLIARDDQVPGLAAVLDSDLLNRLLADVSEKPLSVPERQYIRYKPGTNCLVKYQGGTDCSHPGLYAKAYVDEFDEKLAKDRYRVVAGWAPQERLWALPVQRVLVRQFPFDGRLRSLAALADSESRGRLVQGLFPGASFLGQNDGGDTEIQALAYKPERRFVAKLSRIDAGESVLKFYGFRAFNRCLINLRYLQKIGFTLLPSLLGHSRRRQVVALPWHAGQIFREVLSSACCHQETAVSVGKALAALHRQPAGKKLLVWSLQREHARLQELSDTLAFLVPERATQTHQISDAIVKQLARVPATKHLIHGDFHSKQVLVNNGNVRFLDPDELSVGPAQLDVGTFIAHLYRDGLSDRIPLATVSHTADAFLDGYQSAGGRIDFLNTYIALALFKFSHHPFRACENSWDERIDRILQLACQFVERYDSANHRVNAV